MGENENYTTLEALGIAIKSEVEAIKLYNRMKELAKNEDLKGKLDFLIEQEKKHKHLLTEAYRKKFPEVKLSLPEKSLVPAINEVLEGDDDSKNHSMQHLRQRKNLKNSIKNWPKKPTTRIARKIFCACPAWKRVISQYWKQNTLSFR